MYMSYELILMLITFASIAGGTFLVPYLKNKGVWAFALFGVNIIEQICDFLELQGYGKKKYEFVSGILRKLNPKLTGIEIEGIIEQLVKEMNELK